MTDGVGHYLDSHSKTLVGFTVGLATGLAARSAKVKWAYLMLRNAPSAGTFSESKKMVIVVRSDVSMSAGKIASQCAHAATLCVLQSYEKHSPHLAPWLLQGQPKVVLRGGLGGDSTLVQLAHIAAQKGLVSRVVKDAGKTQVKSGTCTAIGIGPGPALLINEVTGHLKLF